MTEITASSGSRVILFNSAGTSLEDSTKSIASYNITISGTLLDTDEEYAVLITSDGDFFELSDQDGQNQVLFMKNIALIGKVLSDNYSNNVLGYVLIFTPIEAINNTSKIFSIFTLYVTIIFLVISLIVVTFISNRFTAPLREVEKNTKKIADLDFSEKLEIKTHDEIGSLSLSINKMSSELERNINELKEANIKLEKDLELETNINKMRQEFISDVSHELKTPISIIGGYGEALKLEGLTEKDINKYADIIIDESMRMNKLVRDLIKFSQINSGFLPLSEDDFSLRDLVNGVVMPHTFEFEEKGVLFTNSIPDIQVNGDYDMLETVLTNYLTNAIHYMDENKVIEISHELMGYKVRVYVRNTGPNIKDEDKDRIWDSFYKSDKSRTRKYGGSGLGLSIVKSIMEAYKSEYGFINTPDGVKFYFDLNLSKPEKGDN